MRGIRLRRLEFRRTDLAPGWARLQIGAVRLDPARAPARVRDIAVPESALTTFRSVIAAQPAVTLGAMDTPVVTTPPDPTAPRVPTPSVSPAGPSSSRGGGGAPSLWFFLALLVAGSARQLARPRPG